MAPTPTTNPAFRTHPSSRQFGAGVALIRCLPADEVADSYSARLPSSPIGEKSRRAPVGREAADGRGAAAPGRLVATRLLAAVPALAEVRP